MSTTSLASWPGSSPTASPGASWPSPTPVAAGRAVFDATARFHNPTHALEWSDPGIDAAFEGVRSLVLRGLGAQIADPRS